MRPNNKASADTAQVRREQMIMMRERGMSFDEIALKFGITSMRVRQLIRIGLEYRERTNAKDAE